MRKREAISSLRKIIKQHGPADALRLWAEAANKECGCGSKNPIVPEFNLIQSRGCNSITSIGCTEPIGRELHSTIQMSLSFDVRVGSKWEFFDKKEKKNANAKLARRNS